MNIFYIVGGVVIASVLIWVFFKIVTWSREVDQSAHLDEEQRRLREADRVVLDKRAELITEEDFKKLARPSRYTRSS